MSQYPIDSSTWNQLDSKVKRLWRFQNLIGSILLLVILGVPEVFLTMSEEAWPLPPGLIAGTVFILFCGFGQWMVGKSYEAFRYQLGEDDLAVAKGVFWRSWKFINRNRVQHVDVTSGPIGRALGLVQVSIYVGGMSSHVVSIPGLSSVNGQLLRNRLLHNDPNGATTPEVKEPENPDSGALDG